MNSLMVLLFLMFPPEVQYNFENYLTIKYGKKAWQVLRERIKMEKRLQELVKSQGIEISEGEIDFYLNELKSEFPSPKEYRQFLNENNISEDSLREKLRYEIGLYKFIQDSIIAHMNLTGKKVIVPEQRIWREIYISSPYYYSFFKKFKKWLKAWKVRIKLLFGADFEKLVETESESRRRLIGGLRGPTFYDPMNKVSRKLFKMKTKDVAGPIRTKWGYFIIKLETIEPQKEAVFDSLSFREMRKVYEIELEKRLHEITIQHR